MRSIRIGLVMLMISTATGPARAQEPAPDETAASTLVDLLRLEQVTASSMEMMTQAMISQNPVLTQIEDVFVDFFDEFMSWEDLRPEYVRLYAEAYDEGELEELIAFYRTPVGQKTVELTPTLMQQGAEIGQRMVEPHLPELQRRIEARVRGGGPPGAR